MIKLNYKRFTWTVTFSAWENTTDAATNTSTIGWSVKVVTAGASWDATGNAYYQVTSDSYDTGKKYVKQQKSTTNTWSGTTQSYAHNSDGSLGSKTVNFTFKQTATPKTYTESKTVSFTTYARYFSSTPSISLSSKTNTSATFKWSTSQTCKAVKYHLNGSSTATSAFSGSATSGTFTVSGLAQNTSYTLYTECQRSDSGLWSNSNTVSFKTYTTPTISVSMTDRTETSLTIKAASNITLKSKTWSVKNSAGTVVKSSTSTAESVKFDGLSANTTYTVEVYGVSSDGGITSATAKGSYTTYNYPYIVSRTTQDLTVGNSQTITVYNPLGKTCTLYMKKDGTSGTQLYSQSYNTITTSGSVTFTPAAATLRSTIQSGQSANCVYYLTYLDGTTTKSSGTLNGTYKLTGTETPTFPTTSWSYSTNLGTLTGNDTSVVINNWSSVTFSVNTAPTSSYGYTGSYTYNYTWGTSSSSNVINKGNGATLSIKATDARNLSITSSRTLTTGTTYIPYVKPTIKAATFRKDGIDMETHLSIEGTFYAGKFGSNGYQNSVNKVVYYTKKAEDSTYAGPYPSATGIALSNFNIDTAKGTYKLNDFLIHANGSSNGFEIGSRYNVKVVMYDAKGVLDSCEVICDVTDGKIARDVYQDDSGNYHEGINGRADASYAQKIHGNIDIEGDIYKNGKKFGIDLSQVYPVGAIYMSVNATDPGTLFGGTWARLKSGFIYASGATDGSSQGGSGNGTGTSTGASSGSTGGPSNNTSGAPSNNTSGGPSNNTSGSTTLTAAQSGVPAHSHGASFKGTTHSFQARGGGSSPGQTCSSWSNTSIAKNTGDTWANTYTYYTKSHKTDVISWTDGGTVTVNNNTAANASSGHTHTLSSHTHSLSSHTHSLSDHTHSLNSHTHTIPYITIYVWKRTA